MSNRYTEPPSTEPEQVVRGVIKRITFRNPENGYSVLQMAVADQREQLTVVGMSLGAAVGSHIIVRGTFKEHPKFGRQLSANSITETTPSSADGLQKYLSSGLIKGIGEKTASRIVEAFGEKTIETILRDPDRLAKLPGVGKSKAETISKALTAQQETREIMQFLLEHHISPRLANKIFDLYKNRAVEVLSRDPYLLARELKGVGFSTADAIALNLGIKPDAPQRLKAGLYYALERASDEGHCYLSGRMMADRARVLLEIDSEQDLGPSLEALLNDRYIAAQELKDKTDHAYYLQHLYKAEQFVASFIADRTSALPEPCVAQSLVDQCLSAASQSLGVTFSFEQQQAVIHATNYPLMIITGGPGCGKTTIIKALSLVFKEAGKRLLMAAPTGRAAQRMSQVCGLPACTIHRLLRYDPSKGTFLHGINDPLAADVVIIDEASMVDIMLAKDLFSAIPKAATLILVGDKDQLPSVGPGRVFADLISVPDVKTVSLLRLFRRSEESSINRIAHLINSGMVPDVPEPDGVTKADAYFIPKTDPEEAAALVDKLVSDQIPRKFKFSPPEITVLTPSNRGPLGTIALNAKLQNSINPSGSVDVEQEFRLNEETVFRVGDRVCQRVNNYNLDTVGVFNGDSGQIFSINPKERSLTVELWDGRLIKYSDSDIYQLSLAYAMTVHRSQGSEIPCVVLALHEAHYTLLERQLIYTAVTRAKKLLIIVASRKALSLGCKRMNAQRRNTLLRERIMDLLK